MVKYRTPTKTTCLNFARSLLSFVPSTSTVISLMDMRPYAHPSQTPYSHRSVIKPVLTLSFKPSISSPDRLFTALSPLCTLLHLSESADNGGHTEPPQSQVGTRRESRAPVRRHPPRTPRSQAFNTAPRPPPIPHAASSWTKKGFPANLEARPSGVVRSVALSSNSITAW